MVVVVVIFFVKWELNGLEDIFFEVCVFLVIGGSLCSL